MPKFSVFICGVMPKFSKLWGIFVSLGKSGTTPEVNFLMPI